MLFYFDCKLYKTNIFKNVNSFLNNEWFIIKLPCLYNALIKNKNNDEIIILFIETYTYYNLKQ